MPTPRFFSKKPLQKLHTVELDDEAAHHCSRVLRLKTNQEIVLFDGSGGEHTATISAIEKRRVTAELTAFDENNRCSNISIELAIGLSKGDRFDWVIQKATELGVNSITPLTTSRTTLRLDNHRQEKKVLQWQKIAQSACEQSERNLIPLVSMPIAFDKWVNQVEADKKIVLDLHDNSELDTETTKPHSAALLIGPEGGLSTQEIQTAQDRGFSSLRLGPRTLRTETAPIAALTLIQYFWGDLKS